MYGGFDTPAPPVPQDLNADEYVLVTDRPVECPPWRVVVEPRPQLHPRMGAKFAKCRPDAYADADVYIWSDANVRVTDPGFVKWCLGELANAEIAVTPHPDAADLEGELRLSMPQKRYAGLPLPQQVTHYRADGFPQPYGHFWTGLMVRTGAAAVPSFGDAWLSENIRWTYHDQLSLPYVMWKTGVRGAYMTPGWLQGRFSFARHGPEHVARPEPATAVRGWRG